MKTFAKLAAGAMLAAGTALTTVPANAQVTLGVQLGPHHDHNWCYYHPDRCGRYGGYAGYQDGYYRPGYGYWSQNHWWRHRDWDRDHDRWRYRDDDR